MLRTDSDVATVQPIRVSLPCVQRGLSRMDIWRQHCASIKTQLICLYLVSFNVVLKFEQQQQQNEFDVQVTVHRDKFL